MTHKHTSGPWSTGPMEGSQGVRIWQTDNDQNVKAVIGFAIQRKPSRELDAETEANARLIAAAPDLLELCERAFRALDWDDFPQLKEDIQNAIAKATQEPTP